MSVPHMVSTEKGWVCDKCNRSWPIEFFTCPTCGMDRDEPRFPNGGPCERPGCQGDYFFRSCCGAYVCAECDDHKGLVRCYCGWSRSGEDGRRELEEMGEVIDPE